MSRGRATLIEEEIIELAMLMTFTISSKNLNFELKMHLFEFLIVFPSIKVIEDVVYTNRSARLSSITLE